MDATFAPAEAAVFITSELCFINFAPVEYYTSIIPKRILLLQILGMLLVVIVGTFV